MVTTRRIISQLSQKGKIKPHVTYSTSLRALATTAIEKVPSNDSYNAKFSKQVDARTINKYLKKLNKISKRDKNSSVTAENIIENEITELLNIYGIERKEIENSDELIAKFLFHQERPEIVLHNIDIIYQGSDGSGIAIVPKSKYGSQLCLSQGYSVLRVPKTVIGDVVNVRLLVHTRTYAEGYPIFTQATNRRNTRRNNDLILCDKFHSCSGCQIQMLSYQDQLAYKEKIIKRAYSFYFKNVTNYIGNKEFSTFVVPSPMQYSYRSKITPHTAVERETPNEAMNLDIGFKSTFSKSKVIDLEKCPIASTAINMKLPIIRKQLNQEFKNAVDSKDKRNMFHKRSLMLRESLQVSSTGEIEEFCVSKQNNVVHEFVAGTVFHFRATEFFQNNRSILPDLIEYLTENIKGSNSPVKNLVDTYCGSGFFTLTLGRQIDQIDKAVGIEISKEAIKYANHNLHLNDIPSSKTIQFIEGSAESIFEDDKFLSIGIDPKESVVIMDPSRRGSNKSFLQQLIIFRPKKIIYVSCNVFTQAYDLSEFFKLSDEYGAKYRLTEVTAFDFFPQTKHVESVAILDLID